MVGKQDGQKDFFDSYVEQRLLPKEHELLKIDEQVDFSFAGTSGSTIRFYSDRGALVS